MAAKKNNNLEQLRQVAKARQAAANRKVNRLTAKGVKIAGTKHDVRRPTKNIDRYNSAQLANYIGSLNNFVDRKTGFVNDVHGRPITRDKWREYKRRESAHNRIVNSAFEAIKHIPVPGAEGKEGQWETIEQRQAKMVSKHKHVGNTTNSPYQPVVRKSNNFVSEKRLKEMTKKLDKKLAGDFLAKDLKVDRRVVRQMTKTLHRKDIQKRVNRLTDEQFNILFNFWGFADKISTPYELAKAGVKGADDVWHAKNFDEDLKEAERLLGYAEKLFTDEGVESKVGNTKKDKLGS